MAFLIRRLAAACVAVALLAAGCRHGGAAQPVTIGQCAQDCPPVATASPTSSATAPAAPDAAAATTPVAALATPAFAAAPPSPAPSSAVSPSATASPQPAFASATPAPAGCDSASLAQRTLATLTDKQKVGQLFMVGLSSSDDPSAVLAAISDNNVGNVVLYGSGWSSAAAVSASAASVQAATFAANGGVQAFVAGNQEGGAAGSFQAFYGPGFDNIPSALKQGALAPTTLQADAQRWGQQLRAAGVNLDLAPVLDVVAQATAQQNGPIGQYDREFGYDPTTVANAGVAFITGMRAAGEPVSIKHFPGLGRVQGNTDFTDQATVDNQLTDASDPNLQPFKAGIQAGADLVMVGSATYPNYPHAGNAPAMFSQGIVTGLLRSTLDYNGVVISDDVGAAAAVAAFPPAQRAWLFFTAGGDILLTVQPSDIAPMTQAVLSLMSSDPHFAQQINDSALRVLTLKAQYGMLPASQGCATPAVPASGTPAQRATRSGR